MDYDGNTLLSKILRLSLVQKNGLKKLNLETAADLLGYFPVRYTDAKLEYSLDTTNDGDFASMYGSIQKIELKKSFTTKGYQVRAYIEGADNKIIECLWFNQPYIAKMYPESTLVKVSGKISISNNQKKQFINPTIEKVPSIPIDIYHDSLFTENTSGGHGFVPTYKETKGITSRFIHHSIKKILSLSIHEKIHDPVLAQILKRYNLPPLKTAYMWIHIPQNEKHYTIAKKRFAFQEIFLIQLQTQYEKHILAKEKAYAITTTYKEMEPFTELFPFGATDAQKKAVKVILEDLARNHPMGRLLEGDVGSGKTFVAACATHAVITTRPENQSFGTLQVAYMTPTEILAEQQFASFIEYFKHTNLQIGLLTSSGCKKFPSKITHNGNTVPTKISKTQLSSWIKNGEINIVIGTHSLIQKTINFKHLALVIIDEQHRFGMNQRKMLARKDACMPHLLSMTATPIPRTLALTLYGGLDITLLDQLPPGRKKVETTVVLSHKRHEVYEHLQTKIKEGRQAYIICPKISSPDATEEEKLRMKSVVQEVIRLRKDVFTKLKIEGLHSKLSKQEKDAIMDRFLKKEIDILVSTSVIEVGVNIPNATMIIIEGAERFGLAQLHQLRGRVQRGDHQPYCFLFTESKTEKTLTRLGHFVKAKNGFELAEFDLTTRGPGELSGTKQWGVSDIAMEALKNIKLVEIAQIEALLLIQKGFVPENKITHFE